MYRILRLRDWSLRAKVSVLLAAVSLLPLAIVASLDIDRTRAEFQENTEALLKARADQLARELEMFDRSHVRAAAKLAELPDIRAYAASSGELELRSILAVEASVDPQVRGAAILDTSGIVAAASEPALEGLDLSIRSYVREALRGAPVISDVHVSEPEVGLVPTIAYLHPVRDGQRVIGVVALWVRAAGLWDLMRASNGAAGPGSFAVLIDPHGVRVGHTYNDDVVFHPAAELEPELVDAMVSEQRFGPPTRALLRDVRILKEPFERARASDEIGGLFRAFAPVNLRWNFGVSRRIKTSKATLFFMVPEEALLAALGRITRERVLLAGGIALAAFVLGGYLARLLIEPLRSLAKASEAISRGALSTRVFTRFDRDELGRLATSFNAMASRVEAQAIALQTAHDGLEATVLERTAQLRASEEDLAITLNSIGDAVIATDALGRITRMNPAAERLTGVAIDTARASTFGAIARLVDDDSGADLENPVDRILRGGPNDNPAQHTRLLIASGEVRSVAERSALIRDASGTIRGTVLVLRDLSSERAAERELARNRERLSKFTDSGLIGIIVGQLDGKILEINDVLLEMVGYSREEVLTGAVQWRTLTPKEWSDSDTKAVADLRAGHSTGLREKEYINKRGERIPILVRTAMLEASTEETISFVLDLRGNRLAAQTVEHLRESRASEARFRSFLEAAPDAMVIADGFGKMVLINEQAEKMFGYARAELIGSPVEILIPERLRERHPAHRAVYAHRPVPRAMGSSLELFARRKDGSELPVEVSLSPLESEEGVLVCSAIRDVSERKKAEEARSRLAAIIDSSEDAIIGMTLDGVITSWNRGAQRIFGYASHEILGRSIEVLGHAGGFGDLSRPQEPYDTVRRRKDGTSVHLSIAVSAVRDASGATIGISKVARDITERRLSEEHLARAKDRAEAANRELEAFSYSVAHDLRAPLRGMNGFAQILLDDYRDKLDDDGRDALQEILLNARKMGALIDALLSLSRLTRTELRKERCSLSALFEAEAKTLSEANPERNTEFRVAPELYADVDPVLARAAIHNLISNAWKFTAKCAHAVIELGATEKDGITTFFIRDNGAGFDMSFAGKLFAPFQRLHTLDEFPGTGIGLATVQRIVHRHGGHAWAEGAVDRGATFYFTFDRSKGAPS